MSKPLLRLRKPRYLTDAAHQSQVALQVSQQVSAKEAFPLMKAENAAHDDTTRDFDKDYLVRALTHDVGAHLMLLEFSFRKYDELVQRLITDAAALSAQAVIPEHISNPDGRLLRHDDAGDLAPAPHKKRDSRHHKEPATQPTRLCLTSPSSEWTDSNEMASHVTACLDEMKRFVNELISFTKTGVIDMEPSVVSIAKAAGEVLFEQRHLIEKRGIDVTVSSSLPTVFANPTRIKQVLTNLVRNAAIHGCDKVEPTIDIASEMMTNIASEDGAMACFSVRDNGCGIPLAESERIFEPGYRVPGNQNEGSGIGLAIVKKIACYYGGDVVCQSSYGSTTFSVMLPKAISH
ncbi:MAG: HAMP domain-containing histidine kinase [Planctomycetaceae bacterium]|nr:HAMP domain-containing histidine kinase [Planctomycetaceae bacterium]